MGQYYKQISPRRREYLTPWTVNNGAKLMEFGLSGGGIMTMLGFLLLSPGLTRDLHRALGRRRRARSVIGAWNADPTVIGGGYADKGRFVSDEDAAAWRTHPTTQSDHDGEDLRDTLPDLYDVATALYTDVSPRIVAEVDALLGPASPQAYTRSGYDIYNTPDHVWEDMDAAQDALPTGPDGMIVNVTLGERVDPAPFHPQGSRDVLRWLLGYPSPLSLLTILLADGNGRGGGDLHASDDIVGSWAGDVITVLPPDDPVAVSATDVTALALTALRADDYVDDDEAWQRITATKPA